MQPTRNGPCSCARTPTTWKGQMSCPLCGHIWEVSPPPKELSPKERALLRLPTTWPREEMMSEEDDDE